MKYSLKSNMTGTQLLGCFLFGMSILSSNTPLAIFGLLFILSGCYIEAEK